eukprot:TRINITY_DN47151_c0_g1_i1.p1 TRINITY_DN47151_c0_g1~~TRINITY_DN47151_c0_g1_i1.p1  ORF type:complete len:303 (+),score=90.69 TRINITY_DN47151_c0_g1_i1:52-960(+)
MLQTKFEAGTRKPHSDGPAPPALLDALEDALELALTNLDAKSNADGNPWSLEKRMDHGIEVWSSKSNKSSARQFNIKATIPKASPEYACSQLVVIETKCTWDKDSVGWWRNLRAFSGRQERDQVTVEVYTTLPALGGLVKPRAFADARLTRWYKDGTIVSVVRALEGEFSSQFDMPAYDKVTKAASLPRARNLPGGCGVRISPHKAGSQIEMMAHSELGGWLPQGTINNATGAVLGGIALGLVKHVGRVPEPAAPDAQAAPEKTSEPAASDGVIAKAQRRRIRPPGCRDSSRYSWRWQQVRV